MPRLCVFGDEIANEISTQIEVMLSEGVRALELRGAEGCGVLDLDGDVREAVRAKLVAAGIEVFSLGSPLGKVDITSPFDEELARLDRAIEQAHYFGTPRIRIFSFFIPDGDWATWRDEVLRRLTAMAAVAAREGVLLCHENESRIYGETAANCRDLLASVDSPALRAVHDTANFAAHDEAPFSQGYPAVKDWLEYVHIKDWRDGQAVPAGEGVGRMPELLAQLRADGFDGVLSLEPHIGGGPDNFRRAAQALKKLLDELGWGYD